jgi:tRNA nucleotidyltransferase (CCA-adding enzyme)
MKLEPNGFTAPHRRILEQAARWSRESHQPVWLVGGPVRDSLLGRQPEDVDLAVERGAAGLARALADRLGGRSIEHPDFLTAAALLDDGDIVDVVTTRRETYAAPGALPSVRAGTIRDDLLRRDFSVNAIALELESGETVDPAGGRADLEARLLRVLHARSFVDDPTRIFRALRLATRLGFAIEPETETLLHASVEANALATVSRERLWRELRLTMREPDAAAALEALAAAKALDALLGPVRSDGREALLRRAETLRDEAGLDGELLLLDALLGPDARCEKVLPGSGLSGQRQSVLRSLRGAGELAERIASTSGREARLALLDHVPAETLGALRFDERAAEAAASQVRYRETALPFHGDELGVPPGAHLGAALRDTRRAIALGEIAPDEALAFARARALEYLRER